MVRKLKAGQRVKSRFTGQKATVTRGGRRPVVKGTIKGKKFQKQTSSEFFVVADDITKAMMLKGGKRK